MSAFSKEVEDALRILQDHPDFRVIHRLVPKDVFGVEEEGKRGTVLVIDSETTGLDPVEDVAFEIGFSRIEYSKRSGNLLRVLEKYEGQEDPGFPLSEEIVRITGADYEKEVKGKKFDDDRIIKAIESSDVVLAHNAFFDRNILEKRFPLLMSKPWMCSFYQGPWKELGIGSSKLDYLLTMVARRFHEGHRALADVDALTELLTHPSHELGKSIFSCILEKGRQPSHIVWAVGSPFETKDVLKKNGYKWSDGTLPNTFKAWNKSNVEDVDGELEFLRNNVYKGSAKVAVDVVGPVERFTNRQQSREMVDVPLRQSPRP